MLATFMDTLGFGCFSIFVMMMLCSTAFFCLMRKSPESKTFAKKVGTKVALKGAAAIIKRLGK